MAEKLQIKKITFCSGSTPGGPSLEIEVPNVTVLVGPNNSGKSQSLRELESWCQGSDQERFLVGDVEVTLPDTGEEVRSMMNVHIADPPKNQTTAPDHFWVARPVIRKGENPIHQQLGNDQLQQWYLENNLKALREYFIKFFTLRLDGITRFDLVEQKAAGPLEENPENHLWALFVDDDAREKVRQFTEEAFDKHFVIDPTGMKTFRVRLSDRKPENKTEEQALDSKARAFHQASPQVTDLGDGLKTSIGLVSATMSLSQRILLIDEPEAFLHPTLARRVGQVLAGTARERGASLVVATHSADFLMGCIQSSPDLRLVRLTFSENSPTARSIEPAEIVKLMNDPLLRSTSALRALFHRGVIVCEADADRAFYEEVNYRLLRTGAGVEDSLFMNAQNWQTIPRIVQPLRRLGIPAVGTFDFDVLMEDDWQHIWPLVHLGQQELQTLQNQRATVKQLMIDCGRDNCKSQGINAFQGADKQTIQALLDRMAEFGLFFVPVGELECWLSNLGVPRTANKPLWLNNIFDRFGSDPKNQNYVTPANDDVWVFLKKMETWISNPNRLGIPT